MFNVILRKTCCTSCIILVCQLFGIEIRFFIRRTGIWFMRGGGSSLEIQEMFYATE